MPSPAVLVAWVLFGAIGMAAFVYGKKAGAWKAMALGGALMAYPYFVAETWLLYAIGSALTIALFAFRD